MRVDFRDLHYVRVVCALALFAVSVLSTIYLIFSCFRGSLMSFTSLDRSCYTILKTYLELVTLLQRQVDLMLSHYTLSGMSRLLIDQLYRCWKDCAAHYSRW
jgi:hypothetical protein